MSVEEDANKITNRKTVPGSAARRKLASRKPPKRKPWRFVFALIGLKLLLIGFAWSFTRPVSSSPQPITVRIPKGVGVTGIGSILKTSGLVRSALMFDVYARWKGKGKLRAGSYTLSPNMTLDQLLRTMEAGPGRTGDGRAHFTIPEGFTLKQIAATLTAKGATDGKEFLRLATDANTIAQLQTDFPLPPDTLEGYLFPDTYAVPPHSPPMQVLQTMLANFGTRFYRPYQQELQGSGKNLHTLVTEASLIEREAKIPEDRARIAGVIDNRLKRNMRLQVDATVEYALPAHKPRLSYSDLRIDSPYNTYRHSGLPPGPIASPGLPSLLAALRPEANPYLYYVARPNGVHIFTRSLREHEAAKKQARREREAAGDKSANNEDEENSPGE